jgi:hypothetical protein
MPRYDVFLSHASADKPAVEHLARKLRDEGIEPFLDKWHLIPGQPWQEALEEALDQSRTCAVFLGKTLGPWQNEEMRSALESGLPPISTETTSLAATRRRFSPLARRSTNVSLRAAATGAGSPWVPNVSPEARDLAAWLAEAYTGDAGENQPRRGASIEPGA